MAENGKRITFLSNNQFRLFWNGSAQMILKDIIYDDNYFKNNFKIPYHKRYAKSFRGRLRKKIKERDNYTCQWCGLVSDFELHNTLEVVMDVHHIDYDRWNSNERNLITMCHSCHSKTHVGIAAWKVCLSKVISGIYLGIRSFPGKVDIEDCFENEQLKLCFL